MEDWLAWLISFLVIGAIIGNLSLLRRSARPMRKTSLNDLTPTIKTGSDKQNTAKAAENDAQKKDAFSSENRTL